MVSSAPHFDGAEINSTNSWVFFISAIIWAPYTFLMFYLFWEHKKRNQSPQWSIVLYLACGTALRCCWFFLYPYYGGSIALVFMNRIALLMQFSAISLLMLMWHRALTVTSAIDRKQGRSRSSSRAIDVDVGQIPPPLNSVHEMRISSLSRMNSVDRRHELENKRNVIAKSRQRLLRLKMMWVGANAFAWVTVLVTILASFLVSENRSLLYSINLICVSFICLLVNLGIIYVGLIFFGRLQSELSPVYMLHGSEDTSPQLSHRSSRKSDNRCCGSCYLPLLQFRVLFFSQKDTFRMQVEVLRTVFYVSITVAVFFFLRSLCFLYYPIVVLQYNENWQIGNIIYPLFFYQFPEFFPNLVIAVGISPPKGILRVALRQVVRIWRGIRGKPSNVPSRLSAAVNFFASVDVQSVTDSPLRLDSLSTSTVSPSGSSMGELELSSAASSGFAKSLSGSNYPSIVNRGPGRFVDKEELSEFIYSISSYNNKVVQIPEGEVTDNSSGNISDAGAEVADTTSNSWNDPDMDLYY